MKNPFTALTKDDVEELRRKSVSVTGNGVLYGFTETDVKNACTHLKTLYTGEVRKSFAAKILLLNLIY